MTSQQKNRATTSSNLPALRLGSRVRCTDDGVEGRIVWANGVAVKIQWDDGEQVTWKRDSLTTRPIEFLDDAGDQSAAPATPAAMEPQLETEPTATTERAQEALVTMPATTEATAAQPEPTATEPVAPEPITSTTEPATTQPVAPTTQPATPGPGLANTEPAAAPTASASAAAAPTPAKPKRQRQAAAEPKATKLSALDAAAKVLAEEGRAMTCQELITAMAAKGYWTSPGGQTPAATLYSAILRELKAKGAGARFVKTERGQFAHKA
jgi:HB1, ASXL, restriction endonuclease HTH domain